MMIWFQAPKKPFPKLLQIGDWNILIGTSLRIDLALDRMLICPLDLYLLFMFGIINSACNWKYVEVSLCDFFPMFVFCSGISHSYSNQREKTLSKLTRLAINNRRFDGRALESPAPIANQVRYIYFQKSYNSYHFGLFIINVSPAKSYFMEHGKVICRVSR